MKLFNSFLHFYYLYTYPTLTSLKLKLMTILRMHIILARCDRRMFSELRENFEVDNVLNS
jgi:hypothetical protein